MNPTNVRGRSEAPRADLVCPQCGAAGLTRRHCKTVCERCGYVESCEDNFLPTQAVPEHERAGRRRGESADEGHRS